MLWLFEQIEELSYQAMMSMLPWISPVRRAKVLRLREHSAQIQSISAELLLRFAIWKEYGMRKLPDVAFDDNKKPYFPSYPELCFNLSHCATAAACAVDVSPVGVDVQEIGCLRGGKSNTDYEGVQSEPHKPSVEQQETHEGVQPLLWVLHCAERAWVMAGTSQTEQEQRFIRIWTFKEAFGKASGAGILYPLEQYNFMPCVEGGVRYNASFQSFQRKETVLTLCARTTLSLQIVSTHELFAAIPCILDK